LSEEEKVSVPGVKCIVWDLDDTLWDGSLLEDSSVELKPRIPEVLEELDRRGILHSIASRNDYDDAMAKLREFGIAEYFLYPEIGWDAKSVSLQRIRDNIDIGFDTILFVDDRPFERDEVASTHSEVWCLDSCHYLDLLAHPRLKPRYITRDSGLRRKMYLDNLTRTREQKEFVGPKESFLRQLDMVLEIDEAEESDLLRAEELTYRTNQLNATGEKYTVESLDQMRRDGRHKILVCELTDKHGSYGKIGLALIEIGADSWTLKLLLFSCRVLPSGVGTVFLSYLRHMAAEQGVRLLADFRDTGRNRMMRVTYMVAGFSEKAQRGDGMVLLENDLADIPPIPDYVKTVIRVAWSSG
jgi:FkbH-like protein